MNRLILSALLCGAVLGGTAQAHQVWLEQTPAAARLYFGEFNENLRETSPGLLDKFVQSSAILVTASGEQPLKVDKAASGFVLSARAGAGESIVAQETGYPLLERKEGDKVIRTAWTPAARLLGAGYAGNAPKLALDILPTGRAGEYQVFYAGRPLPKAKVGVAVQSGWGRELRTDEQGMVRLAQPWQGTYVLEVHHVDKTAGERNGKPYDIASYVTTLSLTQADGLPALPAAPAAAPNK
ncbi:cobalt ABC transporter substrate-binding protein [Cupriavidus basilensis]|uniref:Cobalt ABC transporter substrate-binding protein n=1 Tax=Cupriavidus basilensis TaxID=68895 RepID=A0ABT6AX24_9BURK|nr:cobalt ABC transporter substrate-binding protein [Cupriavidus basilensis]MDF3837184.1 cobalt ABC transporter substrate-binding protein [Cupriavidus basilensis]